MFQPAPIRQMRDSDDLTDNTCNHQCSKCGECCTDTIALLKTDISRIQAYIRRNHIQPEDHQKNYAMILRSARVIDATCPFLSIIKPAGTNGQQSALCKIYPVRPAVCRAFTCEIASDPSRMNDVYKTLSGILTKDEVLELSKTTPVSMRSTFFDTPAHKR